MKVYLTRDFILSFFQLTCLDPVPSSIRARNAQGINITNCDVTTWSWVNLVNPPLPLGRGLRNVPSLIMSWIKGLLLLGQTRNVQTSGRMLPSTYAPIRQCYAPPPTSHGPVRGRWGMGGDLMAELLKCPALGTSSKINSKDAQGIANIYNAHAQFKFPTPVDAMPG